MRYVTHTSRYEQPKLIDAIRKERPSLVFLDEIALPLRDGGQTPDMGWVFYDKTPKQADWGHYFAFYKDNERWITVGFGEDRLWLEATLVPYEPNLTLVMYSRYGHDFVTSPCGGYHVDGGQFDWGSRVLWPRETTMPEQIQFNIHTLEVRGKDYHVERPASARHLWPEESR